MADEIIGGIGVTITGDYSALQVSLQEAESVAKNAGQQLSFAFESAAASADSLGAALQALANSAVQNLDDQLNSLYKSGYTLSTGLAEIEAQNQRAAQAVQENQQALEAYGASLGKANQQTQETVQVTQQATSSFSNLGDALKAFATTTVDANTGSNNLLGTLLQFGGIVLTLNGIKNAAEEAFAAFAQVQRAQESLTALTGDAKLASSEIDHLRQLAQDDALSFPALLRADQQMRAFGFSTQQIGPLLDAAANASIATGKGFDQTSQAIERMVATGMMGGRQIAQLGLSTQDLANVMGTTTDQVNKFGRALNESARVDIVTEALSKFSGLARQTSDDLQGSWTKLANVANLEFTEIGKALEPTARAFIVFAADEIRSIGDMVAGLAQLGQAFGLLAPQVVGALAAIAIAVSGNPVAALGLSIIQAGLAWKQYQSAQDDAEAAIKQADDATQKLMISERQMFSDFPDYQAKLNGIIQAYQQGATSPAQFNQAIRDLNASFREENPIVDETTTHAKSFTEAVRDLSAKLAAGSITNAEYKDQLQKIVAQYSDADTATKKHVLSLEELQVQTQNGTAEINKAMAVLKAAQDLDDGSTRSKVLEAEALKQLEQAQKKYSDTVSDSNVVEAVNVEKLHQSLDGLVSLYNALQQTKQGYGDVALETDQATQKFESARNSLGLLTSDIFRLMSGLEPLGPAFKTLGDTAAESLDETAAKFKTAYDLISKELGQFSGDAIGAWTKYIDETKKAADSHSAVQTAAHAMGITTVADLTATRDKYKQLFDDMVASGEGAYGTLTEAAMKLRDANQAVLDGANPLMAFYKDLNLVSIEQLRIKLQNHEADAAALSGTEDYARALEVVAKDQKALNDALSVGGTLERYIGDTGVDAFGSKIPKAITDQAVPAVNSLTAALANTKTQVDALTQGIIDMAARWNDFQKNLSISGGISDITKQNAASSFTLENPYWGKTPAEIEGQFNDLMNSFGGSVWSSPGVRALYAAQYALEQAALMNYYETNPTTSKQLGTVGKSTSVTPAGVPTTTTASGTATTAVSPFDVLGLGPNLVQVITDNTQALTNQAAPALASLTTAVTTLTPAVTTATTQITAANQVSVAAFQALAAPITAPTAATAGPLAAFTRPGTPSPLGTFNINVNAQSSDAQVIAQAVTTEINRLGVRFQ